MSTTKSTLIALALAASGVAAQAAAPTFVLSGASALEYTGTAPMAVAQDDTVFWFAEASNLSYMGQLVDSWFVFYDPANGVGSFSGTVDFGAAVVATFITKAGLQSSTAFHKPGVTYDYNPAAIGLESGDAANTSVSGSVLNIRGWGWRAGNPGDHIRVLTVSAVPEPETYALMLAGLAVLGGAALRRKA